MVSRKTENIKCLIKKPKTPDIKPPRHRSIFLESVKRAYAASYKDCYKTMGYTDIKVDPKKFLKRNTRKVIKPFVKKSVPAECDNKTKVRTKYDLGVDSARKQIAADAGKKRVEKNFLRLNIVDAIRKAPPILKHRSQDTRNGHVIVLDEAGLEPIHVMKKNFGKIPSYIKQMNIEREVARLAEEERLRSIKPPCRLLSDDERNELLEGLKTNFTSMYEEFLVLPMITDTPKKIIRKTKMENDLKQLESDIDMLERFKLTYVHQDNVSAEDGLNANMTAANKKRSCKKNVRHEPLTSSCS